MAKIQTGREIEGQGPYKYTCRVVPLAAAMEEADCVASVVRKGSKSVSCGVSLEKDDSSARYENASRRVSR